MYVTLELENVSQDVYERLSSSERTVLVVGLLAHEHRMSVLNCVVKRRPGPGDGAEVAANEFSSSPVVQSKDRLVFQVGFRRYTACPVFSEHGNGNKFKVSFTASNYGHKDEKMVRSIRNAESRNQRLE